MNRSLLEGHGKGCWKVRKHGMFLRPNLNRRRRCRGDTDWGTRQSYLFLLWEWMWCGYNQVLGDEAGQGNSNQTIRSFGTLQVLRNRSLGLKALQLSWVITGGICFVLFHHNQASLESPPFPVRALWSSIFDPLPTHPPERGPWEDHSVYKKA